MARHADNQSSPTKDNATMGCRGEERVRLTREQMHFDSMEKDAVRAMFDISLQKNPINSDRVEKLSEMMCELIDYVYTYFPDRPTRNVASIRLYEAFALLTGSLAHGHALNNLLQQKSLRRDKEQLLREKG